MAMLLHAMVDIYQALETMTSDTCRPPNSKGIKLEDDNATKLGAEVNMQE